MSRAFDASFDAGDDHPEIYEEPEGLEDAGDHRENWVYETETQQVGATDQIEEMLDEVPDELPGQLADQPEEDASGEQSDESADDGDAVAQADRQPEVTAEEAEGKFRDTFHGVRLVYDFGSDKVVGIATWDADGWSWQITPVETTAERDSRQVGINLLTDLAAQAVGLATAPPTDLDEVVSIASAAAHPRTLALKLCNGAVQVLAHHCGLGFMAPALGSLAEQILAPVVDPPDPLSNVMPGMQAFDVTVDVATGHLTPAVTDFAAAELDAALQDRTRGISQTELDEIEEAIRQNQATDPGRCTA